MFGLFKNKVVVRMAPSPTGKLHIGTARTALFNYLFAKRHGGKFILRIDDTDIERSTKEFEKNIVDSLDWLGLSYDKLHHQCKRLDVYKKHLKKLIDNGSAYVSKEKEGDRSEVIRFKNPNKEIVFNDLIRGEVVFDTSDLGDFVLAKSIDEPLYHLASVVDDMDMGVTHIIRGEDHISNTPRQILLQEALEAKRPEYAHLPLILAQDRSKLSKRKHGESVSLDFYREKGYLPQAIINYLALLGWNPGTEQEVFTLNELVKVFNLEQVQKGGAIFDEKKLDWINRQHRERLSPEEQLDLIRGEFDIEKEPILDKSKIVWKKSNEEETIKHLEKAKEIVLNNGDLMSYASEIGKGDVLWPVRYALTGLDVSPDPISLLKIIPNEESIKRIEKAIEILKK